ncbi:carbohydrate ABC transporter membrane protein 2 (CUT1 family) [Neobacillus bataviensis]|uniref:Carbohydrate ABC transporter membrane protein 2 (CUT1 family) n=1 Tax=Neobacillus bataviensis TaxID=220685 RepID=A0A561CZ91_9BACI|nr:carbohydrate ABC transporter permease [Neobacillus bataviensis]TWD96539.1 carbohydrate ABC transporter membrane protein 2 (CUT1 family) [Neobacillus bataviensis]
MKITTINGNKPIRKHSSFRPKAVADGILIAVLLIGSLIMIIPFIWMVITSFDWGARLKIPFPPRFWPEEFSIKTYQMAFTNIPMLKYMINSLMVSLGVIIVSLMSAVFSGYAISKLKFKGSNIVLLLALSTMMIPFEMTMIPQYLMFAKFKLLDTYWSFFLPALNYAFGTFLAKSFIDQLPESLREAAIIDGANEFIVFLKIYLPLCIPVLATMVILQFLAVWNDLLWPLLALKTPDKYTIQLGIAMFSYNKDLPLPSVIMAATTASLIPVIVLYLFLQRYIVESIALSGIKQ